MPINKKRGLITVPSIYQLQRSVDPWRCPHLTSHLSIKGLIVSSSINTSSYLRCHCLLDYGHNTSRIIFQTGHSEKQLLKLQPLDRSIERKRHSNRRGDKWKEKLMVAFLYLNRPMKEIQGSLGFWIPRHGFRIHVLESRIFVRGTWISYSICSWIPDSKAQDSWIPRAKFPGSRIPQVRM